ncbi:hypothetical protein ACFX2I_024152 [Malus domestica]
MEVLIKVVAQAVPAYPMHVFLFPDSLCDDIDSAILDFGGAKRWANDTFTKQAGLLCVRLRWMELKRI